MADKLYSELNKGAWSSVTAYTVGDFVNHNGSSYTCIAETTNNEPPNITYWALLSSKGDQGEQGETGNTGLKGDPGIQWKSTWSGSIAYILRDVVYSGGSSYICIQANTNQEPPSALYWELIAKKGIDGEGAGDVIGPSSATNGGITLFDLTTGKLIKDSGKTIVTTLGADDTTVPTSKGVKDVTDSKIPTSYLDTDGTLAANSDSKVATQKATKTYVDGKVTVTEDSTTTFSNKTLTSPKINEDVALTATATELNNLHSKTVNLGAWTSFTPSWTNLTVGSGTNVGAYCQIGKTVHFRIHLTFAADTSIGGPVSIAMPVTAKTTSVLPIGLIYFFDSGTAAYLGFITSGGNVYVQNTGSTYTMQKNINSTTPFTWTTDDQINISGTYEAA